MVAKDSQYGLDCPVATIDDDQLDAAAGEVGQRCGDALRIKGLMMHDIRPVLQKLVDPPAPSFIAAATGVGYDTHLQTLPIVIIIVGRFRALYERATHKHSSLGTMTEPSLSKSKRLV
jgi:hypothetical protein